MPVLLSKLPRETRRQIRKDFGLKAENKFGACKVRLDGHVFDSKAESERYLQLLMMQKIGEIAGLVVHPRFPLTSNGEKVGVYVADFSYHICRKDGELVIEDVKSEPTKRLSTYRLKRRMMKALGLDVREV